MYTEKKTIFIDGSSGTAGLRIYDRLAQRADITLLTLPPELGHDIEAQREMLNRADIAFLCLPDAAAILGHTLPGNAYPNPDLCGAGTAYKLACALLGVGPETAVPPALLARLLTHEAGQFKGVGDPKRFRVLLNQADGPAELALARETARLIQTHLPGTRVVAAALRETDCVKEVFPC